MRRHLASKAVTSIVLLAQSLSLPVISFSQDKLREESRPRRTQSSLPQTQNGDAAWSVPATDSPAAVIERAVLAPGPEPQIRIGLASDVRSATVSTTGRLLQATDQGATLVALDVARVRLEPRLLSPLPPITSENSFRLQVAGAASREEAEQKAREIKELIDEESQVTFDAETKAWGLLVGARRSRAEAEQLSERLNDAGFDANVLQSTIAAPGQNTSQPASTQLASARPNSNFQLAARTSVPSREVVAFASGAVRSFSSSAPVVLASEDETKTPVRYNERPYRGRIEVFANPRGTLTVVNVLGLEDYVRGVVANELSPGGYPALEAQKAQAIAARTYAFRNRGQFRAQGFDLLPTTRSQVYRGLSSEHPLSTRAVDETRGLIATYNGEPINALYTSTCGGRTEASENIFNDAMPYLRGRECGVEGHGAFASFTIKSSREPAELREEKHVGLARDQALLAVQNFGALPSRLSDAWLAAPATLSEVRNWIASVARLARQPSPAVGEDVNRPGPFATALSAAVFGANRADTLLNNIDVEYYLPLRDAAEIPESNRADVAMLVRDGYLSVLPDATLRPREAMSRAHVLRTISRLLQGRSLLQLQKGTTKPATNGTFILRSNKGKDLPIQVRADAYLFRQLGGEVYQVSSVALVGGEAVTFHVNGAGELDYLEVQPAANGAAAERISPFTNWTRELSLGQIQARLARYARGIGAITDVRVAARGTSRRAIDLELVGTAGTGHVRGGRIRSVLGLREQLFVIDQKLDAAGNVTGFVFTGRGWGHGVGLCQVGAYGLAKQGLTYAQILKAYYTGIELTKLY
ncbi:MAG TPA: SpoIID/LytB domain-containing protein [Pyrinomonadaceae bacterium]|nr:SpoIID/LytB domain-containing protein [Pyrinomonadaceae bacterium]